MNKILRLVELVGKEPAARLLDTTVCFINKMILKELLLVKLFNNKHVFLRK